MAAVWPEPALITVYVGAGIVALIVILSFWREWWAAPHLFGEFPVLFLPPLFLLNIEWIITSFRPVRHVFFEAHTSSAGSYFSIKLSVSFLFSTFLLTPAAIAIYVLLIHAAIEGQLKSWSGLLAAFKRMLPPFIVMYLIGEFGLLLLGSGFILSIQWLGNFALVGLALASLIVNALTCTCLAAMVDKDLSPFAAIGQAVRFAARIPKRVLKTVVIQMLLMGVFVAYSVQNHQMPALTPPPLPSGSSMTFPAWPPFPIQRPGCWVEARWVLAMDRSSKWFTEISDAAGQQPWPLTTYLMETLTILLNALFIAQYSLLYLYAPVAEDKRPGFEVLVAKPIQS